MAEGGETETVAPGGQLIAADGRRVIGLLLPYTVAGLHVAQVTLAPCTFGHLLRWQAGRIRGAIPLLMELSGLTFAQIEGMRQPDDGRVMDAFFAHVHPDIAADARDGRVPLPAGGDYGPQIASEGSPAAEVVARAPAEVDGAGTPVFDGDMPDWAGMEKFGRPVDYDPRLDDE